MTPEENNKIKSLKDRSDVFNHVVEHLRKQGTKSFHPDGGICVYRGRDETMCAVGCLIADDEYDPAWEGKAIFTIIRENLLPPDLKERVEPNMKMLTDLQSLHDNYLEYENGAFTDITQHSISYYRRKWNIE